MTANQRSRHRLPLFLLGAVVTALAISFLVGRMDSEPRATPAVSTVTVSRTALTGSLTSEPVAPDAGPAAVRGWEGTALDGELGLDTRGQVRVDLPLRRRFDYLLSARGVLTDAQLTNRLLQQASAANFTSAQQQQLRQVFDAYLRYLAALGTISVDPSSLRSVHVANQRRQQLRRATLGVTTAEAFFGQDEIEENYALARMDLLQDSTLTAAQRAIRLEALLQGLPPQLRAAERDSRTLERLDAKVQALGSAAADPARVYAARAEVVGSEAAQRLADMDAEDAAWNARMQTLQAERRRILTTPNLGGNVRQRMLDDYIDREFTPSDALRARAHLSMPANGVRSP